MREESEFMQMKKEKRSGQDDGGNTLERRHYGLFSVRHAVGILFRAEKCPYIPLATLCQLQRI